MKTVYLVGLHLFTLALCAIVWHQRSAPSVNEPRTTSDSKATANLAAKPNVESSASKIATTTKTNGIVSDQISKVNLAYMQNSESFMANLAIALELPEFRALLAKESLTYLDFKYAALFQKLNLSPESLGQFKNLIIEKQQLLTNAIGEAEKNHYSPTKNPAEYYDFIERAVRDVNNQIKAVIGETGAAEYTRYEATVSARNTVDMVSKMLSYSDTPLATKQVESLIDVIAAATPKAYGIAQGSSTAYGAGQGTGIVHAAGLLSSPPAVAPITDQAISDSAQFLTTSQLAALKRLQDAQKMQYQMLLNLKQNPKKG